MFEKDIIITGTHASYIKEMKEVAGLFARHLDIYMLAPIMGILNNRKGQKIMKVEKNLLFRHNN